MHQEADSKKIAKWDPATQKIVEYQDDWRKHTIRVAPDGRIWSTGGLTVFDPKYETFTHVSRRWTIAYGIALDPQGNVWVTEMTKVGFLDKIDPVTLKVTKSTSRPRATSLRRRPGRFLTASCGLCVFEEPQDRPLRSQDREVQGNSRCPTPGRIPMRSASRRITRSGTPRKPATSSSRPRSGQRQGGREYPMPYAGCTGMRDFFLDGDDDTCGSACRPTTGSAISHLSTQAENAANLTPVQNIFS